MKTYLITYERVLQFNESSLTTKIKSFQYWANPMKSVWLIKTTSTRDEIYNYLKPGVFPSDKILIINVTNDWISYNLAPNVVNWMKGGL